VDVCVVLVHWGRNYREVQPLQQRLAKEIAVEGPDLVVGHHPHVAQPVEHVDGVPVLYSLGNAAFGTRGRFGSGVPAYGLVALADLERHRVVGLDLRLIEVDNTRVGYQPRPATGPEAEAFLAGLQAGLQAGLPPMV
jgi:poly-gamma-glutamate synthesis protein (capsule biosynthesis protein)